MRDELDAEMADYVGTSSDAIRNGNNANGTAVTNGRDVNDHVVALSMLKLLLMTATRPLLSFLAALPTAPMRRERLWSIIGVAPRLWHRRGRVS